jgi:hypothetical protein
MVLRLKGVHLYCSPYVRGCHLDDGFVRWGVMTKSRLTWILGQEMSVRRADSNRIAIEALENEWLAAETDPAALDRILASDFLHPVPSGVELTKGSL